MLDGGAEFWLSGASGMYMKLGDSRAPVHRVNNSLALKVKTYGTTQEARDDDMSASAVALDVCVGDLKMPEETSGSNELGQVTYETKDGLTPAVEPKHCST